MYLTLSTTTDRRTPLENKSSKLLKKNTIKRKSQLLSETIKKSIVLINYISHIPIKNHVGQHF